MFRSVLAVIAVMFATQAYADSEHTHVNVHNNVHNNVHGNTTPGGATDVQANANSQSNSNSTSSSNTNVANTAQTGDSSSTSSATTGNVTTSATSGDSTSTSSSTSQGGAGGAGGNATGGNATGGNSSLTGSGNGGGATVTETTNVVDNSRELVFFPVQPPALPTTIAVGGVRLDKIGDCGRRVKVRAFEREAHVPQVFGLWQKSISVQTMHGILDGFDTEKPFLVDEVLIPAPFNRKIVTVYGHQLYLTVGQDGQGGGSSGAANYASEKAIGVGLGLSANTSHGVVGVVAVDCVFDVGSALKVADIEFANKKPDPKVEVVVPTPALKVEKIEVPGKGGHWLKVKDRKENPCGAGEGEKCVYVRDNVKVVKDAELDTGKK